ncbi:MAG: hypothetical protein G01um10143_824 [Parcubacteria group bacterium Gr01-1014_3]|nr:MAG: hypothetical protein G01um10143_824 [Parcubacteria group bacterium Gr01-1014_3]
MNRVFLAGYYRTPMVKMAISRSEQVLATQKCLLRTLAESRLGMTDKIDRIYSLGPNKFKHKDFGLSKSIVTESCQDRRAFGLNWVKAGIERIQNSLADIILYTGNSRRLQRKHLFHYEKEWADDSIQKTIKGNHANIFLERIVPVVANDYHYVIKDELTQWTKGRVRVFAAASFALVSEKAIKDFGIVPIAELYNVSLDPNSAYADALKKSLSKINPRMPLGALRVFETDCHWHSLRELIEELKIPKEYINRFGNELAFGDPGDRVADFVKIGRVLDILKREKNDYGAVIVLGDTNANDEILAAACLTLRRIHFWNEDTKAAL